VPNSDLPLSVKVISPNRTIFDGTAKFILAPGKHNSLGIMENHTPMFAELVKGQLIITTDKEEVFEVEGGIVRVHNNIVTILISNG